ncbi:hypothetical protein ACJJTC_015063 [Scirpophaga incertulas]
MSAPGSAASPAGRSVVPHLRILRAVGFCRAAVPSANATVAATATARTAATAATARHAQPASSVAARAHAAYCTVALAATSVYLVQECVYAYQERNDMDKIARVMFLLLCHVTSISKQLVFYVHADQLEQMILQLDCEAYNPPGQMERALLNQTASSATRLLYAYSGTAVVTCTLWLIFPIMDFVRGLPVEFAFWINVDYSRTVIFVPVLMYSFYVTTLVGIANTTMDAFMGTMLHQCKTQLSILRIHFENLAESAREVAKNDSNATYESVLMQLFLNCLDHYKQIIETNHRLQSLFSTAILIQFAIGGWILCMAAYKLVSLSAASIEFASMTLFITCILTELFLYCYYGNEVTVEDALANRCACAHLQPVRDHHCPCGPQSPLRDAKTHAQHCAHK